MRTVQCALMLLLLVSALAFPSCASGQDSPSAAVLMAAAAPQPAGKPVYVDDFGANPFYKPYYGTLTVAPNTDGTSTITYTGDADLFDQTYVGKSFVAFRINKNPKELSKTDDYFPNFLGCRYSTVTSVVDGKHLIVDFAYNGGSIESPKMSQAASGYFFFDNGDAFRKAITSTARPEEINLKSGKVYAMRNGFNAITPSDVKLKTEDGFTKKARIKLSAEDSLGTKPNAGRLFNLNNENYDIRLVNIDIVGPHYTVPTGGESYAYTTGLFGGNDPSKQSARVLELFNSDDWTEYYELRDSDQLKYLPAGYNFLGPNFVYGILYGGTHDGTKLTGMIYLNCINSSMHLRDFSSLKVNVTAGLYKRIIGKSPTEMSEIVEQDIPENRINCVKISGEDGAIETQLTFGPDSRLSNSNRLVTIVGDGSWYQMASQYWEGGTCTSQTNPIQIRIDGRTLYFGNRGDFGFRYGYKYIMPFDNGSEARLWDVIPKVGDVITIGEFKDFAGLQKESDTVLDAWGWGLQVGDVLSINGKDYTIKNNQRIYRSYNHVDPAKRTDRFDREFNYIHLNRLTLDKPLPGNPKTATVKNSVTEYLLTGTHTGRLFYDRDYSGHLFYDDYNFPIHFENVKLRGYFRGSTERANGKRYRLPPLEPDGFAKRYVNVDYYDDSPNPQQWMCYTLTELAKLDGKAPDAYRILIKGPYTKISQFYPNRDDWDMVRLEDNPDISNARLINPQIADSVKITEGIASIDSSDGKDINIDTLEIHGGAALSFKSNGATLTINKFVSHPSKDGVYGSLLINGNVIRSNISNDKLATKVVVKEGNGAILFYAPTSGSAFPYEVTVSNWTPAKGMSGVTGYQLFLYTPIPGSAYFDKVKITDTKGVSLVTNRR